MNPFDSGPTGALAPLTPLLLYLLVLLLLAWPLGQWLFWVLDGRLSHRFGHLQRAEHRLLRWLGADPDEDMAWPSYAAGLLLFNLTGTLLLYALLRLQGWLGLNPARLAGVSPDLAFNTALSFVSNTNWQAYGGETTLSYLSQMAGLTVQNFASAATGLAVAAALMRGFARARASGIGNVWLDLGRSCGYVLLPLSLLWALLLAGQGVLQNFGPYQTVRLLEPTGLVSPDTGSASGPANAAHPAQPPRTSQTLAMGPVASQEAIKIIGTNGGGFFNANSAHPYENPTPLANFLQMLGIFLLPAALCFTFGYWVGDLRQGMTLLAAMCLLFVGFSLPTLWAEMQANPLLSQLGADPAMGNLEGKEIRFGVLGSALFASITTAASCGAVNAMHDSFLPLGGMLPLGLIQLGEVVFGGVGSGLYGMLIFALLAVFLSGLMIGRTPEYLGKKIETFEMKMVSLAILLTPLLVLGGTALALMTAAGRAGIGNPGPHGFSEVLYAFSSAANNNGSAFAGLSVNSPFYNTLLGLVMGFGRFGVIIPVLALAGRLAAKARLAQTSGTLPTHGLLFVLLLPGTVLLVGALNYIPALALGPLVEHLQLFGAGGH